MCLKKYRVYRIYIYPVFFFVYVLLGNFKCSIFPNVFNNSICRYLWISEKWIFPIVVNSQIKNIRTMREVILIYVLFGILIVLIPCLRWILLSEESLRKVTQKVQKRESTEETEDNSDSADYKTYAIEGTSIQIQGQQ